jgi:hypothetical protein
MNTRMAALGCGLAFALAGCAGSGSELTTAGVLGEEKKPGNLAMQSTATGRAIQVGSVAARAVKCGFNFDPAKLKSAFLASEAQAGLGVDELAKTEKVYGVAYSGVAKGVQGDSAYCTDRKSAEIKSDLTRHLAGDFSPAPPREKADDSIWASFFDNASVENGPKFGSQEWWDRQKDKSGL